MKRETKNKISVLKKSLSSLSREIAKQYRYKVIDGQIWTVQNGFIFELHPFIVTSEEGACLNIRCSAKPLYVDDYLWDVLGFAENKKAKMSLRVNGAFSLFGVVFQENRIPLDTLDIGEVSTKLKTELYEFSRFLASIFETETEWFLDMEIGKSSYYHSELMRLMMKLHQGNYAEVLKYVETHEVISFKVDNKTARELIEEYCLARL